MIIKRKIAGTFAALALSLGVASVEAQIRVAVEDGSADGTGAQIVSQLNDDTWADFTATLVTAGDIDTPAELANYDVVLLGGSGNDNADWTAAMSLAVHDFVQAGGGAILTGWGNHEIQGGPGPVNDPLDLALPGQNIASVNEFTNGGEVMSFVGSHPVTDGVTGFSVVGCCTEVNTLALEPGDTQLATSGGDTAVAVKTFGAGRSVYLGPIFMGAVTYTPVGNGSLRVGEPDRLLEQAVIWASGVSGAVEPVPVMSIFGLMLLVLSLVGVVARMNSPARAIR